MSAPAVAITPIDRMLVDALRVYLQAVTVQPGELLETHILWIFLSGSLAYKLKKPVRLPFLDLTKLEAGTPDKTSKAVVDVLDQLVPHADSDAIDTLRQWLVEQSRVLAPEWLSRRGARMPR